MDGWSLCFFFLLPMVLETLILIPQDSLWARWESYSTYSSPLLKLFHISNYLFKHLFWSFCILFKMQRQNYRSLICREPWFLTVECFVLNFVLNNQLRAHDFVHKFRIFLAVANSFSFIPTELKLSFYYAVCKEPLHSFTPILAYSCSESVHIISRCFQLVAHILSGWSSLYGAASTYDFSQS